MSKKSIKKYSTKEKTNEKELENAKKYVNSNINTIIKGAYEIIENHKNRFFISDNDKEYIVNNKDFFSSFLNNNVVIGDIIDPYSSTISLEKYIRLITNYRYKPTNKIDQSLLHSLEDRILYMLRFNNVFENNKFFSETDPSTSFTDIDKNIEKFILKNNDKCTNKYKILGINIIDSFIGKLIISLLSDIEFASNTNTMTIDREFRSIIIDLLHSTEDCLTDVFSKSLSVIYNILIDKSNNIYKFKGINMLNEELLKGYTSHNNFLQLIIGLLLKSYCPTIVFNYIIAIKYLYIYINILMIYLSIKDNIKEKYSIDNDIFNKNILNDIDSIMSMLLVSYEVYFYQFAMVPRSFPKINGKELSDEYKVYYSSHAMCGPIFYLLSQLRLSILSIYI